MADAVGQKLNPALQGVSATVRPERKSGATDLFARLAEVAVRSNSAEIAISDATGTMTYAQLIEAASAFCNELLTAGVRSGDPVAVILGNRAEFLVAAFGLWKCGAVLVPLNERLHERELSGYLADTQARAIVTGVRMKSLVDGVRAVLTHVEHVWFCQNGSGVWKHRALVESRPVLSAITEAAAEPIESESAALMQYSTGSTGAARRVTRSHRDLLAEYESVASVLGTTPSDRVAGIAPFFHSHGLMNSALQALLSGATLHAMESFFPEDVAGLIANERLTVVPAVPFMFQQLADLEVRPDLSSIRVAISAGAPLPLETAEAFRDAYGVRIRQLYGSTETGVISIAPQEGGAPVAGYVGVAVPGVSISIVDENGQAVASHIEGRVRVSSPFAAVRYDNSPGSRESYFSADGFFPGDIGRIEGRNLVLSGRHRGFIDVAGNKVDPKEVENALLELPKVREAVVLGLPDSASGEKIKAVLVAEDGLLASEVRQHCVNRLADFKRPAVIEFRKELPKSPLGKVLRKYLLDEALGTEATYAFDPKTGFQASAPAPSSARSASSFLAATTPFLRCLLVTDGTITKLLEAWFWEPIDVDLLSQEDMGSLLDNPELGVVAGDAIVRRRVVLRGRISRAAYCFAESIIARASLPPEMQRKLSDDTRGVGELLREARRETYRDLTSVRQEKAGPLAAHLAVDEDADVVIRSYSIYVRDQPAIAIQEVFPVLRFSADSSR